MATVICKCGESFDIPDESDDAPEYYAHVQQCADLTDEAKQSHAEATQ